MLNEFFFTWLALVGIHFVAVAAPGPDMALTIKNSVGYGRSAGLFTALGITIGITIHIILVMSGISILIAKFPILMKGLQYGGAAYLVYIGIKSLQAKPAPDLLEQAASTTTTKRHKNGLFFFIEGFATNVLNPKAWIYFTAVFSQFITTQTSHSTLILYGATVLAIQLTWFGGLSIVLTVNSIRKRFIAVSHWIERICGGLLCALGVKLAITRL